ncbi:MAG: hypothetical protein EKK46_13150, partial [Rhodocyclaceae bacterium]
ACNWGGCCVRRFWLTTLSRTLSGTSCAGCSGVQLGRLLRTAFLADYFVKDAFRNELRRVLNRRGRLLAAPAAAPHRPARCPGCRNPPR